MERIRIRGMTCKHCVMAVTKALESIPGLEHVKVDLAKGEATFENKQRVSGAAIRKAVEEAGYTVTD